MPHIIVGPCECKEPPCVEECPLPVIYQGENQLFIKPDDCIDCGLCVNACPSHGIYLDQNLPKDLRNFIAKNDKATADGDLPIVPWKENK